MGFVHDEEIVHPYYLVAIDVPEQMSVSFKFEDGNAHGRIPETVFSIGHDEHYITAKVHPDNNKKVVHYYFIKLSNHEVNGPFEKKEFESKKIELSLPNFSKTLKHLQ